MLKNIFTACFLLFLLAKAGAQSPWDNYELLTTRQGLPHNTVQSLLQDKEGFLWIGTHGGLCKYDGSKLTVFKNVFGAGDNTNWFYESLFEDKDGNIWVGSRSGNLSCYIKKRNIFKQYRFPVDQTVKPNCFYQDKDGTIWIGNDAGELMYISGDSVYRAYTGTRTILAMARLSSGRFILLCDDGIFDYDTHTGKASRINIQDWKNEQVISGKINEKYNTVMTLHGSECTIFDLTANTIVKKIPASKSGYGIFHNTGLSGSFNFFYIDGLNIHEYSSRGEHVNSVVISENEWYSKDEVINCMAEDRSGIIWLGTNSGLYKIDRGKYRFKKYAANHVSARLTGNYVRAILFDDDNNLWTGFRGNAINKLRYNEVTGQYTQNSYVLATPDGRKQPKYIINTLCQLRDGTILAGGELGVSYFDKSASAFLMYTQGVISDSLNEVWSLYEDRKGNIWIGTRIRGLYIYNPAAKKLVQYKYIPGKKSSISDSSVWNIVEDSNGDIWLGTDYGLYRVINTDDVNNLSFEKFGFDNNPPVHVWNIVEAKDGKLFIGTIGEGLHEISADRKHTKKHASFPAGIIAAMAFDDTGNLWVGSVNGLYKYNVITEKHTYFSEDDGLISNDFNFKAFAKSPSGEFLFGGKMGIIGFYPALVLPKDMHSVPVGITSLRIAGYDSSAAIYNRSVIQLTRRQNFLNIGFAVLDFTKPLRHRYRYMLKGFEHKWNYRDNTQPWATYTNLPPGDYSFVVQGSGDGIQWSDRQAVLNFYIKPALWQRPVVQVLLLVFILSAIGWAVYYKTRSVVRKEREHNKIEKQIAGLELKALQAQMNPHFIFNALNSIQQFVIHNNELAANDYLTRFARLMRLFLESSKNRYITLETEIEQLGLYLSLEKLRFEDKFDYTIQLDPRLSKTDVLIPSMLVQPFAENAINHGLVHKTSKGRLHIKFDLVDNGMLKCTIDDDGVGRHEAKRIEEQKNKKHVSRGMQLIEERVKTYNFIEDIDIQIHITDKQPPQSGTKVEISIPVALSVKT